MAEMINSMMNSLRRWWTAPFCHHNMARRHSFGCCHFGIFGWRYFIFRRVAEVLLAAISIIGFVPIYIYSFWTNGWRVAGVHCDYDCDRNRLGSVQFWWISFVIFRGDHVLAVSKNVRVS